MRMYRNLEDVFVEEDSPRKTKTVSSSSAISFKTAALERYFE